MTFSSNVTNIMEIPLGGLQPMFFLSNICSAAHQIKKNVGCSLRNGNFILKNFSDSSTLTRPENIYWVFGLFL
jgi:ABC-type multidrug transport system permease subunit